MTTTTAEDLTLTVQARVNRAARVHAYARRAEGIKLAGTSKSSIFEPPLSPFEVYLAELESADNLHTQGD